MRNGGLEKTGPTPCNFGDLRFARSTLMKKDGNFSDHIGGDMVASSFWPLTNFGINGMKWIEA